MRWKWYALSSKALPTDSKDAENSVLHYQVFYMTEQRNQSLLAPVALAQSDVSHFLTGNLREMAIRIITGS